MLDLPSEGPLKDMFRALLNNSHFPLPDPQIPPGSKENYGHTVFAGDGAALASTHSQFLGGGAQAVNWPGDRPAESNRDAQPKFTLASAGQLLSLSSPAGGAGGVVGVEEMRSCPRFERRPASRQARLPSRRDFAAGFSEERTVHPFDRSVMIYVSWVVVVHGKVSYVTYAGANVTLYGRIFHAAYVKAVSRSVSQAVDVRPP